MACARRATPRACRCSPGRCLARHRMTGSAGRRPRGPRSARLAGRAHPSTGFDGLCWGYPYPWQDVGFFAPRHFPNRVVTSFVGPGPARRLRDASGKPLPRAAAPGRHVPARGAQDAVRGRGPPLRELRARPRHRLDRHGRLGPDRRAGRPAGIAAPTTPGSSARAAGWSATWCPSRPTTAPGSTPTRRRPATSPTTTTTPASSSTRSCSTGWPPAATSSPRPTSGASSSTSRSCSSPMARPGS